MRDFFFYKHILLFRLKICFSILVLLLKVVQYLDNYNVPKPVSALGNGSDLTVGTPARPLVQRLDLDSFAPEG